MNSLSASPKAALAGSLVALLVLAPATGKTTDVSEIELRRLLEPTPSELAQEESGRIYIYDGLRDIDIDHAMREQFDRVEHMMFIRTKKTNDAGAVRRDEKTGEAEVEDDGC
ncbi:MAG: hypothetical protein WBM40_20315 [Thiohalocapsa sp.]|jgi:hypothetical protein